MPDRGGRAGEMRPSAKDIPYNKHAGNRGKHDHTRGAPLPPPQSMSVGPAGGGGETNKGGGHHKKKKQRTASEDKKSGSEKSAKKGRVVQVVLPK